VAILSAIRTPIGKYGSALKETPAVTLGTLAVQAALARAKVEAREIADVYLGHCIQAGTGQNPARQVALRAGIPESAGAATINMVCGSGLKAVMFGALAIRAGQYDLMVVGGMESMSSAPYLLPGKARWGLRYGQFPVQDAMQVDALIDAFGEHEAMGFTGERVAQKFHLTRTEIDQYAARSQVRAVEATRSGIFRAESVPIPAELTPGGHGLDHDEGPRPDTTVESLGKLRPSFRPDGLMTAGNSSQLSDGAAALVLASESEVERRGARPLAWVHSMEVGGVDPANVMEAPIPTVTEHLRRVGLTPEEMDRVEHNEAFASASIAVQRTFRFPDDRFNVHGGAIALGHPIGASGARILVTLLHELERTKGHFGLATLCMGGGNGLSLIVERTDA
jgi:acetyl-CoA C-acetyltransferase